MKKLILIMFFGVLIFCGISLSASDDHAEHDHTKKNEAKAQSEKSESSDSHEKPSDGHEHEEEKGHDHAEEEGHSDKEEDHKHAEGGDDHGEEENSQVGPDKGIIAASESEGIKLSQEAEKNFEIQRVKIGQSGQIEIPKTAIVTAGEEVNLFRYRNGFYKRVDFQQIGKNGSKIKVRSKDLKNGDEIALTGLGFLRLAEVSAFGGAAEGHSH